MPQDVAKADCVWRSKEVKIDSKFAPDSKEIKIFDIDEGARYVGEFSFGINPYIKKPMLDINVPHDEEDLDGLNYLENKPLSYVNEKAFLGTLEAHEKDGKVNNIVLEVEKLDAYTLGYLFYFFMKTCAMSAYLLGINPFNQPGVEIYKKNMFHLLGKKGY